MAGEVYYEISLRHKRGDEITAAIAEALEQWQAERGAAGKPKMFLNPAAVGKEISLALASAQEHGLEVERHTFVLKTEVWIGG